MLFLAFVLWLVRDAKSTEVVYLFDTKEVQLNCSTMAGKTVTLSLYFIFGYNLMDRV